MVVLTIDINDHPNGVISWKELVEAHGGHNNNETIATSVRAHFPSTRNAGEEDSSSDAELDETSSYPSKRKGIYDNIMAKWSAVTHTPASHAQHAEGESSDDSIYSDGSMIDDSDLLDRFERRALVPTSAEGNGFYIISGSEVADRPDKRNRTDEDDTNVQINDSTAEKGLATSHKNGVRAPSPRIKESKNQNKIKPPGKAKDRRRKSPAQGIKAGSKGGGRKPMMGSTFDDIPPEDKLLCVASAPMLFNGHTMPKLPGQGRQKAKATIRPEFRSPISI